ncbi:MAG: hypothetical protein XD44_0074 [Methanobacteriaceae archaeon 41_258]|nr:MAG: hypothetical protein XD44_0074 [Methanobacteriaceae archaeon 41_258]
MTRSRERTRFVPDVQVEFSWPTMGTDTRVEDAGIHNGKTGRGWRIIEP